ncbi:MAG: DUF4097 family beta strand repeat-containing protein, partial [Salinivirgaceae bacterium]|nr:DUF4097 family beta strand repeat-containing protein [Salinivirgaceae bacterium]
GNFHITTQYGNISLNNVSGSLSINSHIGELLLKNCAFESTIETKYTNCYFYNSGGTFNILSNLGAINYNVNTKLKSLNINASGTEITLINKNCTEHNLNLSSLQGKLFIDDCNLLNKILIEIDSRKTDDDKKVLIYNNPAIKSHITIKNKFANISIQ